MYELFAGQKATSYEHSLAQFTSQLDQKENGICNHLPVYPILNPVSWLNICNADLCIRYTEHHLFLCSGGKFRPLLAGFIIIWKEETIR